MTSARWWLVTIALTTMGAVDAAATLLLLERGARELNALPAWLLGAGKAEFVVVKVAWQAVLCGSLARLDALGSRLALPGAVACGVVYAVTIVWEAALLLVTSSVG